MIEKPAQRTISDILQDVYTGGKPDYEELRLTLAAMLITHGQQEAMLFGLCADLTNVNQEAAYRLADIGTFVTKRMNMTPNEALVGFHPDDPDFQRQRAAMEKLADQFMDSLAERCSFPTVNEKPI